MSGAQAGVLLALSLAPLALSASAASAWQVGGDAQTTWRGEPLLLNWSVSQCGNRLRSDWRDSAGTLLAWDEVESLGDSFVSYRLERLNLGESIEARRTAAGIELRTNRIGVTSTKILRESAMLAGAMLVTYAQQHLAELRAGRVLRVSYLLADRNRSLDLAMRPVLIGADGRIGLDVVAASPLLRPFVPPAMLWFTADGKFIAMSGQIPPQLGSAQQPEALIAQMTVHAERPANRATLASNCHI